MPRRVELLVAEDMKQPESKVKKKYRVAMMSKGLTVCATTCLLTRYDTDPALVV